MNSRQQLVESLYQARQAFDAIEEHLDCAEDQARATLARLKVARSVIDVWRTSVVHAATEALAHGNESEGGDSPPSPQTDGPS